MRSVLTATVALGVLAVAPAALACSYAVPARHEIAPEEIGVDTTAPGLVSRITVWVKRGRGTQGGCGDSMRDSCDDLGVVQLTFDPADDDRTPTVAMGYLITVSGRFPDGLQVPTEPVRAPQGEINLVWIDDATDDQERFDLDVTLTAVDLAGNAGPPSTPIVAADPGSACSVGAAQDARRGWTPLLAVALGLLWARRRR